MGTLNSLRNQSVLIDKCTQNSWYAPYECGQKKYSHPSPKLVEYFIHYAVRSGIGDDDDGPKKVPTVRLLCLRDSTDGQRQKIVGAKATSCYACEGKSVSARLIHERFSESRVVDAFVSHRAHRCPRGEARFIQLSCVCESR